MNGTVRWREESPFRAPRQSVTNWWIRLRKYDVEHPKRCSFPFGRNLYVDKVTSGFLLWQPELKAYVKVPEGDSPISWEQASQAVLETLGGLLDNGEIYSQLVTLWAQESSQSEGRPDLRNDHVQFIKSLGVLSCCSFVVSRR